MTDRGPLLSFDLSRMAPQTVAINGIHYALRDVRDLNLRDQIFIEKQAPILTVLFQRAYEAALAGTPVDEAEEAELLRLVGRICTIALDAPAELLQKFNPAQKVSLVHVFLARGEQPQNPTAAPAPAPVPGRGASVDPFAPAGAIEA